MYKFQPVLELLRNKSVQDLQNAFGEDYESKKGLSYDSFNSLIKSKLCLKVKDEDVYHLFCQIDRYSKGNVTSKELDDYLCEYEKKRLMPPEGPFEDTPTMYPGVRSQDRIVEWTLYPEHPEITNETADNYFSISRNGILNVWTKDMKKRFETTIETLEDRATGKAETWPTCLTCLPRERLLAVATASGDIRFFRSSIYKCEHKFSILWLPYIVLRLDCYASEKLICGDISGNVFVIHMEKSFFTRNQNRASHLGPEKILFDHLKLGKIPGLAYECADKLHSSPIQKVEYIPSLMGVISCSLDTKRAMMIYSLKRKQSVIFVCQGGIICFAFCKKLNCIITGGADYTIKRWNPRDNSTYNETLTGHTSPINHILVFESRLLLISIDREKIIRVWDLVKPRCLQIIKFKESEFPGKQSFSCAFLDSTNNSIILTTYKIGKLKFFQRAFREKTHPCSEYIQLAAYSSVYNCLVTVGNAATISVWDFGTGSLVYEFENSHTVLDSLGMPQNMGILTAGLDSSERRLVTADRRGIIKIWNFHLGICLQTFETGCTILALSFAGYHIYAAGTSKVVIDLYDDGTEKVDPVFWDKHHKKSIVSMDWYGRGILASATPDGEIMTWKSNDLKIQMKDLKEEDVKNIQVNENYLLKSEIERRRICSVSQILFLQAREMDFFVGNLVSCGIDGRIRFWNIVCERKINKGRLLSKFKAVFNDNHGVLCLATDAKNHYLISGDTVGYIRVYDLDNYYDKYGSATSWINKPSPQHMAKFPFLRLLKALGQMPPKISKFYKEPEVGFAPFLLNCFRAHLRAILKISCVSERDILITASTDSSVRIYTVTGVYVGRLGPINETLDFAMEKRKNSYMPPDIKPAASSFTLYVMNNGKTPLWSRAMKALRDCRLGHQPEDFSEKPLKWNVKKAHSNEDISSQESTLEEELAKRLTFEAGISKQKLFKI